MSRIGKQPVAIPDNVTVTLKHPEVSIKGPKGQLSLTVHPEMDVAYKDKEITVTRRGDSKEQRSLHGLTRSLIFNMVQGVTQGFQKKLNVIGIGYRVIKDGNTLVLNLGYSQPVRFPIPQGIEIDVDRQNNITISGIDKQFVGQVAANIRQLRKVEPYKGKGIRYDGEYVVRKAGKAKTGA